MRNKAAILCNAMTFFGTFAVFFGGEEGDTAMWPSSSGILFQILDLPTVECPHSGMMGPETITKAQATALEAVKALANVWDILDAHSTDPQGWVAEYEALNDMDYRHVAAENCRFFPIKMHEEAPF